MFPTHGVFSDGECGGRVLLSAWGAGRRGARGGVGVGRPGFLDGAAVGGTARWMVRGTAGWRT